MCRSHAKIVQCSDCAREAASHCRAQAQSWSQRREMSTIAGLLSALKKRAAPPPSPQAFPRPMACDWDSPRRAANARKPSQSTGSPPPNAKHMVVGRWQHAGPRFYSKKRLCRGFFNVQHCPKNSYAISYAYENACEDYSLTINVAK